MYNTVMKLRDRQARTGSRRASSTTLVRWLLVGVLAVLILLLVVLVRLVPEPPPSAPTGDEALTPPGTLEAASTPELDTPAVVATGATPSSTPEPTLPPDPTATPTPLPSPTPTLAPTDTPVPTPPPPTASDAPLAGRVELGTYHSAITGRAESYRAYLPPGYDDTDQRYPTLYLFHGYPYDETHWVDLGVEESADAAISEGRLPPFIIVLPRANSNGLYVTTSGGPNSFESQVVNELVPHIEVTYRTLQTRDARAIGGISRGGVWSLQIAFTHPGAFGVVGAHSPALAVNRAPPAHDPFVLVGEPGVEDLRIYLSTGDGDWARTGTWEIHQALDERGIESRYALHTGIHVDSLWAQHIAEYLAFYTADW